MAGTALDSNTHKSRRPHVFLIGALLVAIVFLTFSRVLTFDLVRWDDDINITQNPLLTSPWSWELCGKFFESDHALRFKPLHWLIARAIYSFFGFDPIAWHAFNLLLHGVAAVLFFLILRRLLQLLGTDREAWASTFAALGAAIWALHPLRAEAVGWATASTYPLAAAWLLASFLCFLQPATTPRQARRWLMLAWIFAAASYASYPVGLTYGIFLLVVESWLRRIGTNVAGVRADETRSARLTKHLLFLLPALVALACTLGSRFSTPGIFTAAPSLHDVALGSRGLMALASLSYFGLRLFWPANLTPNMSPIAFADEAFWRVPIMALVAVVVLATAWIRRRELPGFACVCFGCVALSLPCLGLTERPTWPVDRYTYLVHVPLLAGAICFLAKCADATGARRLVIAAAAALMGICALGGARQVMIWQDSGALFSHMERAPNFAQNARQQGHVYILWARHEASNARRARAAELFDRAQATYLSAMRAAVGREDYADAWTLSTHLERYFPLTGVMRRERGAWLLRLARFPEALVELRAARTALPDDERVTALLREVENSAVAK